MDTNIGYWEKVIQAPTPAYSQLFNAERAYLLANIRPDSKVLDIGCGDGRNIKVILEKTKDVAGIDNDQIAIASAVEKLGAQIQLLVAEADDLPYKDKFFDIVTLLMVLPNLDDRKIAVLSEIARVLKTDGFAIVSTFAETAFEERSEIYKNIGVPIDRIEGTKFIFDKGVGAHVSEQFSLSEIRELAVKSGLNVIDYVQIGKLACICKLVCAKQ